MSGGLAQLSAEERQVITLAYLEGRTNRQIAALLGVSVSTVRRRLWAALERLDDYARRAGTWISSVLLFGLAYEVGRAARHGRLANAMSSAAWPNRLAATLAAGSVTLAAVGLVATSPDTATHRQPSRPATAQYRPSPPAIARITPTILAAEVPSATPPKPPPVRLATVPDRTQPLVAAGTAPESTDQRDDGDKTDKHRHQKGDDDKDRTIGPITHRASFSTISDRALQTKGA